MFTTEPSRIRRLGASCWKLATFGIDPPQGRKLLKYCLNSVKWGLGYVAGDYSVSGPHLFVRDIVVPYATLRPRWPPQCGEQDRERDGDLGKPKG
jgi:hypothetical protein